jgi:arsenate reductase (glutaredoxin)
MIQVLHNPRCGKSRNCLAILKSKNKSFEIINYLNQPLQKEEIKSLLKKLNIKPIDLVRQKETIWIKEFKNKKLSDDAIITAMSVYPILIERPIIIHGDVAFIAREIEKLEAYLT